MVLEFSQKYFKKQKAENMLSSARVMSDSLVRIRSSRSGSFRQQCIASKAMTSVVLLVLPLAQPISAQLKEAGRLCKE